MELKVIFDEKIQCFTAETESGATLTIASEFTQPAQYNSFRPMQLMAAGLAACMGTNMVAILRKMRQKFSGYTITLSATRDEEPPKVFTTVTMLHHFSGTEISPHALRRAVELSEKYCSAFAMFTKTAVVRNEIQVTEIE